MIMGPGEKRRRQKLYTSAATADICLFIVDPTEVEPFSEDIKELIFGACFMMSARNVIVVIDLRKYSTYTGIALQKSK